VPNLGSKKFAASYFGPIRLDAQGNPIHSACQEVNLTIPSLTLSMFDKTQLGTRVEPKFLQDVIATHGVEIFDNSKNEEAATAKGVTINA
jgi:hypothetical protein